MLLSSLFALAGLPSPPHDREVHRLITDSRLAQGGDLFLGMPGSKVDGAQFAEQAIEKGALAALVGSGESLPQRSVYAVPDILQVCAQLAGAFYGYPAQTLTMVGVTGTNGKTTTAHLIEFLLKDHFSPALLGTLYTRWSGFSQTAAFTTPFAIELQAMLRHAVDDGCNAAVMEVSSHALDQKRVWGCPFEVAVFTNLTQDHLDYHQTLEAYFAAKALLFSPDYLRGTAVLNWDDPAGKRLADRVSTKLTYSLTDPCADFYVTQLMFQPLGVSGSLHTPFGILPLRSPLVGSYNVMNVMAAVASALCLGVPMDAIAQKLPQFQHVPGRLEQVTLPDRQDITVVVDYAHTPDSLANVLLAMRPFTKNKLICVFGCGGDRDRTKRPIMGEIAARLADRVFVTSDNPRTEDPQAILDDILRGISAQKSVQVNIDRRLAIQSAIIEAGVGDTVVIAGKGHEDYQIIGTQKIHFDDREEARCALQMRG